MSNARSRWEEVRDGPNIVLTEWRQIHVDPAYEISKEGVLRRINSGRILKDQKEFRYFDGNVRRSISVRKLRNRAWAEDEPS